MKLNTLKRYARASAKAIEKSAISDNFDPVIIGKRIAGNIRAMQKINTLEPYNGLSSVNNIMKKWGKL
jgi:hypothetical protein